MLIKIKIFLLKCRITCYTNNEAILWAARFPNLLFCSVATNNREIIENPCILQHHVVWEIDLINSVGAAEYSLKSIYFGNAWWRFQSWGNFHLGLLPRILILYSRHSGFANIHPFAQLFQGQIVGIFFLLIFFS